MRSPYLASPYARIAATLAAELPESKGYSESLVADLTIAFAAEATHADTRRLVELVERFHGRAIRAADKVRVIVAAEELDRRANGS